MAVLAKRNGNSIVSQARAPGFEFFPELPRFGRLIDAMMNAPLPREIIAEENFVPAIDVYEKDNNYVIDVALPGFRKDDISIEVQANQVTISGRYEESKDEGDGKTKPRYSEIRRASFTRTVVLPREVDPDRAKATFENGVLSITLPPSTPITGKKIEVSEK
jgi:HSP20 family protein